MSFAENVRYLRRLNNCSQNQLSDHLGYKSFTTIQKWEDGTTTPPYSVIQKTADYFGVSVDDIMNTDLKNAGRYEAPVLGMVRGGAPILAEQNYLGHQHIIPDDWRHGECFYLEVVGDSMKDARLLPGDLLYVQKQDHIENGEIAVVMIDGEATVKTVVFDHDLLVLKPANENYSPIILTREDMENRQVRIIGKVLHNRINFS